MHPYLKQHLRILVGLCLILASAPSFAAEISTQLRSGFARVNFAFDQPAKLQMSANGTRVVLNFDTALGASPTAIETRLAGYVRSSERSTDGKQLILTLTKPYRVRQFVSGNAIGIDMVGAPDTTTSTAPAVAEPEAENALLSTKKPIPALAKPTAATKPKANAPKAPPRPTAAPAVKAAEPILTTKKPEPPAIVATAPLTIPQTPSTEAADVDTVLTTKEVPVLIAPAVATPPAPAAPQAAEAPAPVAAAKEASAPFLIGARKTTAGTAIDFPWRERTAAVIFERANTIWIVFARPADANAEALRSVLPRSVTRVTQYAYPGHTVLRLNTDGSIHANAAQEKGRYGWNVLLSSTQSPATLDAPVSADITGDARRILISAFDVAEPLRFYDPEIGDLLLLIPAYENGRGVVRERQFPELQVANTAQGIAIRTTRDDLSVNRSRIGITISAPTPLLISENLPVLGPNAAPAPTASAATGVLLPYDQWYVAPKGFRDALELRLNAVLAANKEAKPEALLAVVGLYLGHGNAPEAQGYLRLIAEQYPDFYKTQKLAVIDAATNVMMDRMKEAALALTAPELVDSEEANLWREVVGLYAPPANVVQKIQTEATSAQVPTPSPPAPAPTSDTDTDVATGDAASTPTTSLDALRPTFRFLKYNKPFIQFYPPRIRQKLAIIAADAYLANGQEEKALAAFESLNRDGILEPIKAYAEFAVASIAAKKGQPTEALALFDILADHPQNPYIRARARYAAALLRYRKGSLSGDKAAEIIETARVTWRGDVLERQMLGSLAEIYKDGKRYDDTLRSYKTIVDEFSFDPEILTVSTTMSELFQNIYLDGLADDMPPLKALSLFNEFSELTPLGDKGDLIIQKLADRLASFDLISRATQLLENQIKFRVSGEVRSKVGARLALLYMLNKQPQEALTALQTTNFGNDSAEVRLQRQQLTAQALSAMGKHDEAIGILFNDTSREGALLRLEILWAMKDWPNVVNRAEDILAGRPNLTDRLSDTETGVLLKLALAYTFEGDYTQLRYLRDYYSGLIPDTAYKQVFDYITNDTAPLDTSDISVVASQISNTEGFLSTFKSQIASGKLSETVK